MHAVVKKTLHGPLGFGDGRISHFTGTSAPTDPWNITTVYNTGLVDIKALYDLPESYDPQVANINFTAAACTISN